MLAPQLKCLSWPRNLLKPLEEADALFASPHARWAPSREERRTYRLVWMPRRLAPGVTRLNA
eukprot:367965-Pleurochrysis_carterae.AAC.1